MHDTITATVESAHFEYDKQTTVDLQMWQMDDRHRRHARTRLAECFEEVWGHPVIVTINDKHVPA